MKASEIFEGENSSLRKTYEEAVTQEIQGICGKTILKRGMKCTCLLPLNHIGKCKTSPFVIDEYGNKVEPKIQEIQEWDLQDLKLDN